MPHHESHRRRDPVHRVAAPPLADRGGAELDVEVTGGTIRGVHEGDLLAWRGVPFAAPPVGPLRLRAPAPVVAWTGIRDASGFGPMAPQPGRVHLGAAAVTQHGEEDCLSANVHAPADRTAGALPVMVFIHGGGYYRGSSRDFAGQGESFVRSGRVVYVSFNYRLGALGYLDFTRYSTAERPIDGNLGLRDQVAALEWVRQNISAFGGDPARVTVFGESAGGNAVTTLLAVPAARGLFHGAIAQSAPANAVYPAALAGRWAAEFVALLRDGSRRGRPGPATRSSPSPDAVGEPGIDRVLDASLPALLAAAHQLQERTPEAYPGAFCFAPVVDGDFLPERPIAAIRGGRAARVPLIIGTNEHEGRIFRGELDILPATVVRMKALFQRAPAETRGPMRDAYPGLPRWRAAADFGGDYGFWYPTTRVADFHSHFAPVHAYRFDVTPRFLRMVGLDATHGVEMFTLFDSVHEPLARTFTSLGGRASYIQAGVRMRRRWLRFAETGGTHASWPAYTQKTRATLIIDDHDRVQADPHHDRRRAWDGFLPELGGRPGPPPAPETPA
ncbi:carboxylesterase/lipase family protein [Arthrobacter sp.]|uniref:carboxylesterase/lipase family protein n=1 Tax=Arthrobacter sp. TaxID=1667 RepID=UPI003A9447E7